MCALTGEKLACLDKYDTAIDDNKIIGNDAETSGRSVTLYFKTSDVCRGYKTTKQTILYFHKDDYDDIKKALDGPGKVKFFGLLGVDPTITSASWQEVGV